MTRSYRIGGLVWVLTGPEFEEPERMSIFRCEGAAPDFALHMNVTGQPALPELPVLHWETFTHHLGRAGLRGRVTYLEHDGRVLFTERENGDNLRQVEFAEYGLQYYGHKLALRVLDLPHQILKRGGVFLHASYIQVDGRAILFTAPKQTGKSTQAELWRRHRGAQVVNGDRALLRKVDGVWQVFGSPYCGTSDITHNVTCPLGAIVVLGQAKENHICPAKPRQALSALLNGFTYHTWDSREVEQVMELADSLIREIPILKLDCVPEESAVRALEEVLWK